jgi:hypothetical protein
MEAAERPHMVPMLQPALGGANIAVVHLPDGTTVVPEGA